jgi:hypothetical protein
MIVSTGPNWVSHYLSANLLCCVVSNFSCLWVRMDESLTLFVGCDKDW